MTATTEYLAVLKASYDYEPQSGDEVAIKEDQIVFLVERTDDEWWKVKVKQDGLEDKGPIGLVPASYLEDATPISTVKALYDYEAAAPGELAIQEDEELLVYEKEDEWILVKKKTQDKVGYVPANYCDEPGAAGQAQDEEDDEPSTPPRPDYVAPEALVAANSPAKGKGDDVQTWSVSEVDAKNKKKKGTLGVGKGSIFFASESDKTPVQKWDTKDIASVKTEKSKHIHIEIAGDKAASLHFHASSSKDADAIVKKLELSKALALSTTLSPPTSPTVERTRSPPLVHPVPPPLAVDIPEQQPKNNYSVRFKDSPNSIIPPPDDTLEGSDAGGDQDEEGEAASALYDFAADGEDELSVREGEKLRVLDRTNEEWWKCRNVYGAEGVVPASYIELEAGESPAAAAARVEEDDDEAQHAAEAEAEAQAAREAEERAEQERQERERKRKEETERKAKAAAAADRQRKAEEEKARQEKARREAEARARREEQEAEEREEREERARRAAAASAAAKKAPVPESRPSTSSAGSSKRSSRPSEEKRRKPSPSKVRTWHDRTGQFQVDAEFLGFNNGLLRLHKTNGVIIEVPSDKMSAEDMQFIDRQRRKAAAAAQQSKDDDDVPLGVLPAAQGKPKPAPTQSKSLPQPKKGPSTDWFEFFLNAGCDIDDCTRYAASFERDKIDEAILPDIKESTLRSLGLREGDIIRVTKVIEQRRAQSRQTAKPEVAQQLRSDEELARHLQAEEDAGIAPSPAPVAKRSNTTSPAPNLFASPDGVLKAARRGRPPTSKTAPPSSVDVAAIGNGNAPEPAPSPALSPPPRITTSPSPVVPPKTVGGFDDDAWTVRPSKSPAPPAAQPQPPTVPPAPTPPPAPPAPAPPAASTLSAPTPAQRPASTNPTGSSQDEITMRLLAKIDSYRPPSAPTPATTQPLATSPPPAILTPPASYQSGMGMGSSPVPIGQHLQQQQTGYLPSVSPRGPLAPVPQNQGLLQPLVPTTTGFNGFVPARPASNPPSFQSSSPFQSQSPFQTSPFQNPSGFNSQPLLPQATGYMSPSPMQFQQTGMPQSGFNSFGSTSSFGSPFAGGVQTNPTGFNPSFNTGFSAPPPVPPLPASVSPANAAPANIFASMKAGTFASEDNGSQTADYDALRQPMSMTAQPTGYPMNGYQTNGFQTYGFQQR